MPDTMSMMRASAVDIVHAQLSQQIIGGRLRPGTRLRQKDLAEQFGVSIIPVREALRRLEADDLVQLIPNRGAVVASFTKADFVEITEIRLLLEVPTAREAVPRLSTDAIARLEQLRKAMLRPAVSTTRWLQLNRDLRLTIVSASGNERLVNLIAGLIDASRRYRTLAVMVPHHRGAIKQINANLFDACRRRDADEAAACMESALKLAIADVASVLEEDQTVGAGIRDAAGG